MEESQGSSTKTSELIRVCKEIDFQASILALDAALDGREGVAACGQIADEIRSVTGRITRHRATPADQAAQAAELATLTQSLYDVLDSVRAEMEQGVPHPGEPPRTV